MSKRAVHKAARGIAHKVGCHKDIEQIQTGNHLSFKMLTHLGVLKGKLKRGEIVLEQIPNFLMKGQNGGGPTRKERRHALKIPKDD